MGWDCSSVFWRRRGRRGEEGGEGRGEMEEGREGEEGRWMGTGGKAEEEAVHSIFEVYLSQIK